MDKPKAFRFVFVDGYWVRYPEGAVYKESGRSVVQMDVPDPTVGDVLSAMVEEILKTGPQAFQGYLEDGYLHLMDANDERVFNDPQAKLSSWGIHSGHALKMHCLIPD